MDGGNRNGTEMAVIFVGALNIGGGNVQGGEIETEKIIERGALLLSDNIEEDSSIEDSRRGQGGPHREILSTYTGQHRVGKMDNLICSQTYRGGLSVHSTRPRGKIVPTRGAQNKSHPSSCIMFRLIGKSYHK